MRHLILHIGHGKTGTSFIQSVLSINSQRLNTVGLYYPYHQSFQKAKEGHISSGNGALLDDEKFIVPDGHKTLLSKEQLFHTLLMEDNLYQKAIKRSDKLELILYTRDVMEVLSSSWGQSLKRGGNTESFSEYIAKNQDPHHRKVLRWLEASQQNNLKIIIRNYSQTKDKLIDDFIDQVLPERSIDIDLELPKTATVNRSLTKIEYEIQRIMNIIDKKLASQLSDGLVNMLPNVRSSIAQTDPDTFYRAQEKYQPIIDQINRHLPANQALKFGDEEIFVNSKSEEYTLSSSQLDIIESVLSNKFKAP